MKISTTPRFEKSIARTSRDSMRGVGPDIEKFTEEIRAIYTRFKKNINKLYSRLERRKIQGEGDNR